MDYRKVKGHGYCHTCKYEKDNPTGVELRETTCYKKRGCWAREDGWRPKLQQRGKDEHGNKMVVKKRLPFPDGGEKKYAKHIVRQV